MRFSRLAVALLLVDGLAFGQTPLELVRGSQLIFYGTVRESHKATTAIVQPTDMTAVVRVDELFEGPSLLEGLQGRDVTLQLRDPVRPGQQAVFFTNGWLFGQSIALVEVGRLTGDRTALHQQIVDARSAVADERLRARLGEAILVIGGRVITTRPAERQRGPITEHDPDWWEALIQVRTVEKGRLTSRRIIILFPHSKDVMWVRAPKFTARDEGIWILHRDQMPGLRVDGLTALDREDFLASAERARVRRLLHQ